MNILEVASEAVPFAKSGGLGDVLGALPEALSKAGHRVKLFLPYYKAVRQQNFPIKPLEISGEIVIAGKIYKYKVQGYKHNKLPLEYYFIENDNFFNRSELYRDNKTGEDYKDNDLRFVLFSKAVLETNNKLNWRPDVIHLHDWQTGLIPAYLKNEYQSNSLYKNTKTVLTIHNLAYQGTFKADHFKNLGLPDKLFYATAPFEFFGKINFLKGAISFADKITTVSPQYAKEIQSKEFGCGLDGVLKDKEKSIFGILNGVDYKVWSPSRDKKIPYDYYHANLSGKRMNKVELLNETGMPYREKVPLIGIISRLADQKGFDLIEETAEDLFNMNIQMILVGTGEEKYHKLFKTIEQKYPDKFKAFLTFDDVLAHKIEAASDMFLMPSQFEPCGLNQMYSLKYGTVPIVRKVGGLANTVIDFTENHEEGTGFVFEKYTTSALLGKIEEAVQAYQKRKLWIKIMKRGMKQDFSWKKSAEIYIKVFSSASV